MRTAAVSHNFRMSQNYATTEFEFSLQTLNVVRFSKNFRMDTIGDAMPCHASTICDCLRQIDMRLTAPFHSWNQARAVSEPVLSRGTVAMQLPTLPRRRLSHVLPQRLFYGRVSNNFSTPSWFTMDTSFSFLAGYWPNCILNALFLLGVGLPLAKTRRFFCDERPHGS